ncbi:matrixin family metalloprotease [Kineosporia sp. J2-2]|uniref:Matrixin family metalloprotease n=1 Tax=Kineosporia corallincola TaxID=2835133 RepID=A0ABS5TN12_9ACTN|nr:matrixin family metalloprotease [Kineosporia corallincola]MBT0772482.1 matrixin family metalloprotease [Kineosporia corallincola]
MGALLAIPFAIAQTGPAGAVGRTAATRDPGVIGTVTPQGAFTPASGTGGLSASDYSAAAVKVKISGPATMTASATYSVKITGSSKVCGIIEQSVPRQDMKKPYTMPIKLTDLKAGKSRLKVYAVGCSTTNSYPVYGIGYKTVSQPVHVNKVNRWIAPVAEKKADRALALSVTTAKAGVTAKVLRGGTTVKSLGSKKTKKAAFTWKPGKAGAGAYTVAVKSGGKTIKLVTSVTAGWAPMNAPFARCKTITWSYDNNNQPARAKGMAADIASGFDRISKATGITFKKVSKGTIRLSWAGEEHFPDGETDADGLGGSSGNGTNATRGTVWFNTASRWVGQAGYGRYDGAPGRGALIVHEISHSLGLGHVTSKAALMYPISGSGSPTTLTKAETAGLNALYNAKSC